MPSTTFLRALPAVLALVAGLASGPLRAQTPACDRIRAGLADLDRAAAAIPRNNASAETLRRQRADLDRSVAYARSLGCQRQRFLFFGDPPPPQCGPLEGQIVRLEASVAQLEAQALRSGTGSIESQRSVLMAAYDAQCRGGRQPGVMERLFGADEVPPMPDDPPMPQEPSQISAGKTLCVRKCDGYYFPISPYANRAKVETDAQLCQASCPAAEVELFIQPSGGSMEQAVSMSGTPYTSLPNAFKYRKAVDSACTCRRPGQSWVEALGDAEKVIGDRKTDIVVTPERADELSRPLPPGQARPSRGATPTQTGATSAAPATGAPASGAPGIRGTQGETREVTNPDGSRRNVRVVAPTIAPPKPQN